ncbi:hypothetical protein BKA69DRAFT_1051044 [Paraphysoderma sedebokerense]|nr:hypothetical protein BKA69DRAFT_1051044 [Paraphysoderma sedebokerense]
MLVKSELTSAMLNNSHSSPEDPVMFFYIIQSEQSDRPWLILYLWSPFAPLCSQLDMTPDSPRLLLALHFAHNSLESQPLLSNDIPFGYDEPLLHSFSSLLRHHSTLTADMGTSEMNSNHMGLVNMVLRYLDEKFNTDMTMVLVPFQSRGQIPPLDSAHYDFAILRHLEPDISASLINFLSTHKNYFLSCPELEWHNLCQTMATSFHSLCFEITGKRPDLTERDPSVAAFVIWISENLVIRNVGRYKKVHGYDDNEILDLDATISPVFEYLSYFSLFLASADIFLSI